MEEEIAGLYRYPNRAHPIVLKNADLARKISTGNASLGTLIAFMEGGLAPTAIPEELWPDPDARKAATAAWDEALLSYESHPLRPVFLALKPYLRVEGLLDGAREVLALEDPGRSDDTGEVLRRAYLAAGRDAGDPVGIQAVKILAERLLKCLESHD